MLNERGKLIGDFTMCRINAERFLLIGTYAAERFYQRWFEARTAGFDVQVRACAMEWLGLALAGPASREVLQTLVDEDLSTKAFPFMNGNALVDRSSSTSVCSTSREAGPANASPSHSIAQARTCTSKPAVRASNQRW